jgi:hypothetical protein
MRSALAARSAACAAVSQPERTRPGSVALQAAISLLFCAVVSLGVIAARVLHRVAAAASMRRLFGRVLRRRAQRRDGVSAEAVDGHRRGDVGLERQVGFVAPLHEGAVELPQHAAIVRTVELNAHRSTARWGDRCSA